MRKYKVSFWNRLGTAQETGVTSYDNEDLNRVSERISMNGITVQEEGLGSVYVPASAILAVGWPDREWVFLRRGKRIGAHLDGWDEACVRAGVPDLLFHDLRRSAVRNMERAGMPRTVAMRISGHRTESTYRRYAIASESDKGIAKSRMETYFEKITPVVREDRKGSVQ